MKKIELKEGEFDKLEDLFGIKFDEESKAAILVDESCDIMACAGSGKTTTLLAKLTLLADRMPFENNKGVCVLTHTNVAIDEIRDRLGEKAEKLFKYPNFFGTIQTFVNQYLAIPYFTTKYEKNPEAIGIEYYNYKLLKVYNNLSFGNKMSNMVFGRVASKNKNFSGLSSNEKKDLMNSYVLNIEKRMVNNNFDFYVDKRKILASTSKSEAYPLFKEVFYDKIFKEGILSYNDAYLCGEEYLKEYPNISNLFTSRFKYVLIDEMQDTKKHQYSILERLFPHDEVIVQRFGDKNQAIFDKREEESGWTEFLEKSLPLPKSKRFGENLADIVCNLRISRGVDNIVKILGNEEKKDITKHPCIILYDDSTINKVLDTYIDIIEKEKLPELVETPKFYAISRIGKHKKHTEKHLSLFKYTSNYEKESDLRKIKDKNIFNYIECNKDNVTHPNAVYEISINTILEALFLENKKNEDKNSYFNRSTLISYLELNHLNLFKEFAIEIIQVSFKVNQSDSSYKVELKNLLERILKEAFKIETPLTALLDRIRSTKINSTKNIYENSKGIPINLNTIHGAKGQTHTATLLLDSRYNKTEEFEYFKEKLIDGINTCTYSENDIKYSTKLAYVAMTRPTHLLCLALNKKLLSDIEVTALKQKKYNFYNSGEDLRDE